MVIAEKGSVNLVCMQIALAIDTVLVKSVIRIVQPAYIESAEYDTNLVCCFVLKSIALAVSISLIARYNAYV